MSAAIHELSQGAEKQLCLELLWDNVHSYGGRFTCSIAFFLAKALSSEDTLREEEQLFVSVFKIRISRGKKGGEIWNPNARGVVDQEVLHRYPCIKVFFTNGWSSPTSLSTG